MKGCIHAVKFVYNDIEYPALILEEEGYEEFETLVKEPSGDWFLVKIDSCGGYELLEIVSDDDVIVLGENYKGGTK